MNNDLRSQLQAYGQRMRAEMRPTDIEEIGDPLVVLKPRAPEPSRRWAWALAVAVAALVILFPILATQDDAPVASSFLTLVPAGRDSDMGVPTAVLNLSVPDGWSDFQHWAVVKNGSDAPTGMIIGFAAVANVFADRCQWIGAERDPMVGPTVDDLANALQEVWGADATTPAEVVVGGFSGQHMVLTVPSEVVFDECDQSHFQSWIDTGGGYRWFQGPGQIEELFILDVDGTRLVINAAYFPETPATDRAELEQIIDSIRIESAAPAPIPTP